MRDSELKELLLETCPVLPGQEARAWAALQSRLANPASRRPAVSFGLPGFGLLAACTIVALVTFASLAPVVPSARVSADSQSAGIFATAFYSPKAHAQVVWLNGMEPASDRPTFLDPTTSVESDSPGTPRPGADPNGL